MHKILQIMKLKRHKINVITYLLPYAPMLSLIQEISFKLNFHFGGGCRKVNILVNVVCFSDNFSKLVKI